MSDQDLILHFLRQHGPSLPSKVAKVLNTQILFASAHLSDLSAQRKVKISSLKIGGSPLYYLPGQEEMLHRFAAGNINPKDVQVLDTLKEKKVLQESALDLLFKVSLRSLKDFAVPLQVTVEGKSELFWKWHLLSMDEAQRIIGSILSAIPAREKPAVAEPTPVAELESSFLIQKQLASQQQLVRPEPNVHTAPEKPLPALEIPASPSTPIEQKSLGEHTEPPEGKKPARKVRKPALKHKEEEFLPLLEDFFKKLHIHIEQQELIRKNTEFTFLLKVPSAVGQMTYYCKAKNKARCDEKDLSSAYMEAQIKKLPLLLLYTEEFTIKAQEMLETGAFENVVVKKIG